MAPSVKWQNKSARTLASARRLERTERRIYKALCSCEAKLACLKSETNSVIEVIGKLQEDHRRIMSDIAARRDECGAAAYVPEGMYLSPETSWPSSSPAPLLEDSLVSRISETKILECTPGLDIFCYETIWNSPPHPGATKCSLSGSMEGQEWENLDWLTKDFPELTASALDTSGGPDTV
jgi:hypothetical protein